jgi:hypothetical protein
MAKRAQSDTVQLKWRTKEPMRAALEGAAKKRGVSMNQEITRRVEKSFFDQRQVDEAFGSHEIYGLMKVIGAAFQEAGRAAMALAPKDGSKRFVDNPYAYGQAAQAAVRVLRAFRPHGPIVRPPKSAAKKPWGDAIDRVSLELGKLTAESVLDGIRTAVGLAPRYAIHALGQDGERELKKPSHASKRLAESVGVPLAKRLQVKKGGDK